MRIINAMECSQVAGGDGVSAETIGCAVGGAAAGSAGLWAAAAGCVAGAYVANNWEAIAEFTLEAMGTLSHVNLTM